MPGPRSTLNCNRRAIAIASAPPESPAAPAIGAAYSRAATTGAPLTGVGVVAGQRICRATSRVTPAPSSAPTTTSDVK